MKLQLSQLGSVRLALFGMVLLAGGAALSYGNPDSTPVWVLVVPLLFLAVNLLAAIATNPRINRRPGLLVFHLGLLGVILLVGFGRLTHMDAHLEIIQGSAFDPSTIHDVKKGPWHFGDLQDVKFVEGAYTVDYAPGMVRGLTHNHVSVPDGNGGWVDKEIGDDRPLTINGYRFYTTFNKGFSPILTWMPDNGKPITGTINMPSYPLFSFKQENTWTPPNGKEIKFWLRLKTGMDPEQAWVLDGRKATGKLVVNTGDKRVELNPGEQVRLDGGVLRYEDLTTWMGFKIFYDPTLKPLFITAIIAVLGMAAHFKQKFDALSKHINAPAGDADTVGGYVKLPPRRAV
jgi:cytochrome c biogenesis protein ResB